MSMSYWTIDGVGLDTDKIIPYLNSEKLAQFLIEQLGQEPGTVTELKRMVASGDFSSLDIEDYLYGQPFDNIADLLTHCDDTDSITYGDDGEGSYYFYYPPSMPWEMRDTEPKNIQEVHNRIIAAVQQVADLESDEIDLMIDDDLHVVGFG